MRSGRLSAVVLAALVILVPAPTSSLPRAIASVTATVPSGADWMGALSAQIGSLPLDQIVLPGSHDADSVSIPPVGTPASAPAGAFAPDALDPGDPFSVLQTLLPQALLQRFSVPWSRAQDISVAAQLSAGVRYLDVHVCAGPMRHPGLYACHGLYGAPIAAAVIDPVSQFLAAHPTEIVVLDMHEFSAPGSPHGIPMSLHQALAAQIHAAFRAVLLAPGPRKADITLAEVWRTTGRVIVLYNNTQIVRTNPDFWPYTDTIIAWPNTATLSVLQQRVRTNLLCRCDALHVAPPASGAFFDLQLQMTPTGDVLRSGTFGLARVRSLRDLAASNVPMLTYLKGLLSDTSSQARAHLNVVTTDYSELPTLLPFVVALNTGRSS
jgi:NAD(P)-dependent dehydrogenase (short-subunit alcohol dehydrogenase family)